MNSKRLYRGGVYLTHSEFNNFKRHAKQRNIEFVLTIKQIEDKYKRQNKKCKLTGRHIEFNSTILNNPENNGKAKLGKASLDRTDSKKPYEIKNIQIVHVDANLAKQQLTNKEFLKLCKEVVDYNAKSKLNVGDK